MAARENIAPAFDGFINAAKKPRDWFCLLDLPSRAGMVQVQVVKYNA